MLVNRRPVRKALIKRAVYTPHTLTQWIQCLALQVVDPLYVKPNIVASLLANGPTIVNIVVPLKFRNGYTKH